MVCFFFFKDDFSDQKTGFAAARTILHQLFTADRSLVTVNIVERLKNYGDKITLVKEQKSTWTFIQTVSSIIYFLKVQKYDS